MFSVENFVTIIRSARSGARALHQYILVLNKKARRSLLWRFAQGGFYLLYLNAISRYLNPNDRLSSQVTVKVPIVGSTTRFWHRYGRVIFQANLHNPESRPTRAKRNDNPSRGLIEKGRKERDRILISMTQISNVSACTHFLTRKRSPPIRNQPTRSNL